MANFETTEKAAEEVHLSKWFLYRNVNRIPAAHRAGRALRWDVEALKEWMRGQVNQSEKNV